jgi:hypothetical protein
MFQHALPENDQNPLPPALPGEVVTETKLHRFRLRQLQDLAQAYGIAIPDGATKNEIMPIMVSHERAGVFRQPPRSQYHLIRAEMNHDEKLDPRLRAEREQRIRQAEGSTMKAAPIAPIAVTRYREPREIDILRSRCKELKLNSFGKTMPVLKQMIRAEEAKRAEQDSQTAQLGSGEPG